MYTRSRATKAASKEQRSENTLSDSDLPIANDVTAAIASTCCSTYEDVKQEISPSATQTDVTDKWSVDIAGLTNKRDQLTTGQRETNNGVWNGEVEDARLMSYHRELWFPLHVELASVKKEVNKLKMAELKMSWKEGALLRQEIYELKKEMERLRMTNTELEMDKMSAQQNIADLQRLLENVSQEMDNSGSDDTAATGQKRRNDEPNLRSFKWTKLNLNDLSIARSCEYSNGIHILDIDPKGRYLTLLNHTDHTIDLCLWKVIQIAANKKASYIITDQLLLRRAQCLKIWSPDARPAIGAKDQAGGVHVTMVGRNWMALDSSLTINVKDGDGQLQAKCTIEILKNLAHSDALEDITSCVAMETPFSPETNETQRATPVLPADDVSPQTDTTQVNLPQTLCLVKFPPTAGCGSAATFAYVPKMPAAVIMPSVEAESVEAVRAAAFSAPAVPEDAAAVVEKGPMLNNTASRFPQVQPGDPGKVFGVTANTTSTIQGAGTTIDSPLSENWAFTSDGNTMSYALNLRLAGKGNDHTSCLYQGASQTPQSPVNVAATFQVKDQVLYMPQTQSADLGNRSAVSSCQCSFATPQEVPSCTNNIGISNYVNTTQMQSMPCKNVIAASPTNVSFNQNAEKLSQALANGANFSSMTNLHCEDEVSRIPLAPSADSAQSPVPACNNFSGAKTVYWDIDNQATPDQNYGIPHASLTPSFIQIDAADDQKMAHPVAKPKPTELSNLDSSAWPTSLKTVAHVLPAVGPALFQPFRQTIFSSEMPVELDKPMIRQSKDNCYMM